MDPNRITYFAETDARNKKIKFGIKSKDRLRHTYVIGKTGVGKSTLLENMAIQDIQNGEGMAFVDPHGGTAEKLLDYVPEHRIKDVLYFAPFDLEYPVSFNIMEDIGLEKRHLVMGGLMSAFGKLFGEESFSDRMQYILQNTILALLEYPGSSMLGINKMLVDKEYRNKVISNITDPSVKTYWTKEYAGYTERFAAEAIPAIQNKIGQFTSNPLVRNIIGQGKSSFDFREIMDKGKIMIINLSKGKLGEGNANLIGSMLITKIYLAAMSRADKNNDELSKLPSFNLYVDEFQSFANKSFADILSEARKYKLSLNIAHQYIEQMDEEVRDAVFGNVGTMITFRVGAFDAEVLEKEFAPVFTTEDLVNLGFAQIYLKLMIDGVSSQPFSARTMAPIPRPDITFTEQVLASSREQFASPRAEVEANIIKWHGDGTQKEAKPHTQEEFNNRQNNSVNHDVNERHDFPRQNFEQQGNRDFVPNDRENNNINRRPPETVQNTTRQQEPPKPDPNKQAFMKAAEMLREKEVLQKQQPISLSSLAGNQNKGLENKKDPTKENISSLKEALSRVIKKSDEKKTEPKMEGKSAPVQSAPQNKTATIPAKGNSNDMVKKTAIEENNTKDKIQDNQEKNHQAKKEVPEDVLRNLLKMDDAK